MAQLSWTKMMVACSKTVARGWGKTMGVSRDVAKDIEPIAIDSLEIETFLYGSQDKRTLATQQTIDTLSKISEAALKPKQSPKAKAAFCTSVPQYTVPGKAKHSVAD
ncbi:hypothetical protein U0070_000708 [Myodes glareolus]|uniref:Uncharacterized protein n=1 Tax=Myodes glareolus TaxID=447135 RepID=A0AAW0J5T7_MYOGA